MFYRRKIILSILEYFNCKLEKIALQKLLFLFTEMQKQRVYDFVPYKFGCYSFSAAADLSTMLKRELIAEKEGAYVRNNKTPYISSLKPEDQKILIRLKAIFNNLNNSTEDLIKFTYTNYPYTATKSIIAEKLLTDLQNEIVKKAKPVSDKTILFTIGYEGISLEEYFNRLIKNDIKILVDTRSNPLSMKYGFSKTLLQKFCINLEIQYIHYPDVGIKSEQRRQLKSQDDYDTLFTLYRKDTLPKTANTQNAILALLKDNKRIALTCFEAEICQCHRKHLAESIEKLPDFKYEVIHI